MIGCCVGCAHWQPFASAPWAQRMLARWPEYAPYGECTKVARADPPNLAVQGANQGCTDTQQLWTHQDFGCVMFEERSS